MTTGDSQPVYAYPGALNPDVYEWENRIADPEGLLEAHMQTIAPFRGATIVDIGAGSAFHAWRYAESARHVFAVEPSPHMLEQAFGRLAEHPRPNLSLISAGAEDVPLRDGLADVIHSRFAYFFGPESGNVRSCEPGIREAQRLLKPGGTFFVIDNCLVEGDFATFLAHMYDDPAAEEAKLRRFWLDRGFQLAIVASSWRAPDRDTLRRVIEMEFRADQVDAIMAGINGAQFSYHYNVYHFTKA